MTEENDGDKKHTGELVGWLLLFVIIIIIVGITIIIAMQFLSPTIGNVFPGGDELSYMATQSASECDCDISRNTWGNEVLIGRLVVIVPKTIVLGEQNQVLAFAYSPKKYSDDEIDEHIQSFLQRLDLSEDRAYIIERDVIMNTWGFPGLIGFGGTDHYRTYDFDRTPQFIDPDNVTVWNMNPKKGNTWSEGLYDFALRVFYSGTGNKSVFCGEVCLPNNFPDEAPHSHMDVNLVLQGQNSE